MMNSDSISFSSRSSELNDGSLDGTNNEKEGIDNPDPDTIKMFVGQIPKTWDELKLKEFFQQYGSVYHLNILREKETENSRGCCFVTFYHRKDAINAQNALHNIFIMPGLNHPVQMKPADVENRNERKLFVGMLSKTMVEEDVRDLFKEYGHIEELTILKENGKSKGCAFLTFVNRSCAQKAIRKMNQSKIFEGCTKPVVVKFADSGREKIVKKEDNRNGNNGEANSQQSQQISIASNQVQQSTSSGVEVLTNLVSLLQQPGLATLLESARVLQQLQQTNQQPLLSSATNLNSSPQSSLTELKTFSQLPSQNAIQQQPLQHYSQPNITVQTTAANLLSLPTTPSLLIQPNLITGLTQYPFTTAFPTLGFGQTNLNQISPSVQPYVSNLVMLSPTINQSSNAAGPEKNSRGPDGCNLFIYHLPQEFTDSDLYATFCSFGNILSAKVFIDKQTNLSKCFGFVSYSDEESAQSAINGMNGHQIGNKRLKVQLKRSEKPYDKPSGN